MADISNWQYKNANIDSSITPESFVTGQRTIIYVKTQSNAFTPIGVVQAFTFAEQRQIEMIFELGSDKPLLIPGRTTGQLQLARILVGGKDLANALNQSTDVRSLKDIRTACDILFAAYKNTSDSNASIALSRLFVGCWITARQENITSQGTLVAENVSILYTDIADFQTS